MAAKFGTSGLRGLVTELTSQCVADHVRAFVTACDTGSGLCVGRDLRPSSPGIAANVIATAQAMGVDVTDCGAVPTPALAMAAQTRGTGAVMVTGSHIPADRNGLKFYSVKGEITKEDEAAITAALGGPAKAGKGNISTASDIGATYVSRYISALGPAALAGRRIGVYTHSAVARDLMLETLRGLGAEALEFGRSENFIPVDTEAVDPETTKWIAAWVKDNQLDAMISCDGDSDRPLLADETGRIVPGDVLGQITAEVLGVDSVVTPVSSNSGVARKGFGQVIRTRIGSPYVIAAMQEIGGRVVGYEANGGFLLGFAAEGPEGPIPALPTRDAFLPLMMVLIAARGGPVSARIRDEPPVVTLADRLQEIAPEISATFLARLTADSGARTAFLASLGGQEAGTDLTDGLRINLMDGRIVHLRPSGNAPEFRLYVEATDQDGAQALMASGLRRLREALLRT